MPNSVQIVHGTGLVYFLNKDESAARAQHRQGLSHRSQGLAGWVLDAGSRGFCFSRKMSELGLRVIAMDPAAGVIPESIVNVIHLPAALWPRSEDVYFLDDHDQLCSRVVDNRAPESHPVSAMSIESLMTRFGISIFDAVKLDIEGGEYPVLSEWPGPVAKQISVEWHPQFVKSVDRERRAVKHIEQWYRCVLDAEMDSLFVLRDQR